MAVARNHFSLIFLLACFTISLAAQPNPEMHLRKVADSGGPLIREQAAYDVLFYRLKFTIDTAAKSISGNTFVRALAMDTLSSFVLDLNSRFTVQSVVWKGQRQNNSPLLFSRPTGRLWIALPYVVQKSDSIIVEISYQGTPKVSTNPPWDDGFVWKRTETGEAWAGVACELEGADAWWPCKDHPSDEPDSVDLYFTVPASLTCVSNGRLLGVTDAGSMKTFHWYVSEPINNYGVTFYLGPYQRIPVDYRSVTGEIIPSEYWFLSSHVDSAKKYMSTWLKDLRFYEDVCGPFPFRSEKYCIMDAPYYGMEHQTCIAYGNNFGLNSYGFDYIHLHELAHEWWGNMVTAKDWSDFWLHEGFATYMEALFVERQSGSQRYRSYMAGKRSTSITRPIAPDQSTTAQVAYLGNIYNGGAWVLHTLRYYVGDSTFFKLLRRWAYPDPATESATDGRQCRLATTEEFRQMAEQLSGKALSWFFTVYLRQAGLPQLIVERKDTSTTLQWNVPNNIVFPMPVEVQVGSTRLTIDMSSGTGSFTAPKGITPVIDPDAKIFMMSTKTVAVEESGDHIPPSFHVSVYPNPFNPSATLYLEVPKRMHVSGELYTISGQRIAEFVNATFEAGTHAVPINCANQSSGVYFVVVRGDEKVLTEKIVLLR
jgi:aminopeptidase N